MGSLGRELVNGVDQNYGTASVQPISYTVKGQAKGTQKGAFSGPLPDGSTYSTKIYTTLARPNTNYAAIVDVLSNTNSNYSAMVAQLNHRMASNVVFNLNYTWAKSLDFCTIHGHRISFEQPVGSKQSTG